MTALVMALTAEEILESNEFESAARVAGILLLAFVAVWVIERLLSPLVRVAISEQMEEEPQVEIDKRVSTLSHVIFRTVLIAIMTVTIITILPEFGISVGPLIAAVGLAGLAIGFGAQNLVRDVINGVFILVENQYGKGDVVNIASIGGLVEDINLRRTVLRDLDGTMHFIPHGQIDATSNLTKGYARVNLNIGVAYDSDLDHVFAVINRVGAELAQDAQFGHLISRAPQVERVDNFADSAIEIKILGDTRPIHQWAVTGELRRRLKKAFDEEGIVIPFPQRTIHAQGLVAGLAGPDPQGGRQAYGAQDPRLNPSDRTELLGDNPGGSQG